MQNNKKRFPVSITHLICEKREHSEIQDRNYIPSKLKYVYIARDRG